MKIKFRRKPRPWLYIRLRKDPPEPKPGDWISLSGHGGDFVLTKDDPDGPLGGWWVIFLDGWMYEGETWYKAIWTFITKYRDDNYIVG